MTYCETEGVSYIACDIKGLQACDILLDPYYSKAFMSWIIIFNCLVLVINDISKLILSFFIWFMRSGTFMHMHAVALMVVIVNVEPESLKKILSLKKERPLIRRFRVPSYVILRRSNTSVSLMYIVIVIIIF
jgi:hypothetical protein